MTYMGFRTGQVVEVLRDHYVFAFSDLITLWEGELLIITSSEHSMAHAIRVDDRQSVIIGGIDIDGQTYRVVC